MAFPSEAKLAIKQVKDMLAAARLDVDTEERLPDNTGSKLTLRGRRVVVNVRDNGSWNLQGAADHEPLVRKQLRDAADAAARRRGAVSNHLAGGG